MCPRTTTTGRTSWKPRPRSEVVRPARPLNRMSPVERVRRTIMASSHNGWLRSGFWVVTGLLAAAVASFAAADEDDPQAKRRLAVMQAAVEALEAKSDQLEP